MPQANPPLRGDFGTKRPYDLRYHAVLESGDAREHHFTEIHYTNVQLIVAHESFRRGMRAQTSHTIPFVFVSETANVGLVPG